MAYIDPGSGSYLFQLLAGTALGVGTVFALAFRRTIARLMKRRSAGVAATAQPAAVEPTEPGVPRDLQG